MQRSEPESKGPPQTGTKFWYLSKFRNYSNTIPKAILLLLEFGWVLMDVDKVYYETYDTAEAVYDTMEQNPTRDVVPSVSQII